MIITVHDETGERFMYNTAKDSLCLCPGYQERPAVVSALQEAVEFLKGTPVIAHGAPRVGGVSKS